ncbi:hypothetical protein M011DRAFT_467093 [Sporormia fimetaria CBS 119925]|uniref:RING-CH-type domain-containing protein n=1 Tax=Sporormia fimetaria CBS 119925 TaxID=1340428 RepID=A0A6A6VES0_9PLEO|nr:hypothetical protein M011DRAFT_467093 [Sporormia fimetaria CBS 119925]
MESLPSRPEPQRRASRRDMSPQHEQPSTSSPTSSSSPVLLNSPSIWAQPTSGESSRKETSKTADPSSKLETTDTAQDDEPRRCWICFNDETEDDENTSEWRSPCPCVLVAHEKCLLDWIADMEAPSAHRQAGRKKAKVLCPQCKSEIKLHRPKSVVVDAVRAVEALGNWFLVPGLMTVATTAVYTTLTTIGKMHIIQIFGEEDALRILAPLYQWRISASEERGLLATLLRPLRTQEQSMFVPLMPGLLQGWRLYLGLPMIPVVLMASRTTWADSMLPFIPLIFFVKSGLPHEEMLQFTWPPSAAFTFATLPYLRGFYNAYYERVWRPREQKWLREIQPGATTDQNADQGGLFAEDIEEVLANADAEEGDIVEEAFEIDIDMDIFGDWNGGGIADNNVAIENPPAPIARGPDHPQPADNEQLPDLEPIPEAPNAPIRPRQPRVRHVERNIAISATSIADTIIGALFFPSIAAAVGELLKVALPKSWVTPPLSGKPTGFLQAKWGRSIVGGCLFVGVKDAVMLYVRWKMAQNHRKRSVLDYDHSKGKKPKARSRG